ncbi:unnamed protein product, partial [Symbiodinium sp. KB8]
MIAEQVLPEQSGCAVEDAQREVSVYDGVDAVPHTGAVTTRYTVEVAAQDDAAVWSAEGQQDKTEVVMSTDYTALGSNEARITFSDTKHHTVGAAWELTAYAPAVRPASNFSEGLLQVYGDALSSEGLFFAKISTAGMFQTNEVTFWCADGMVVDVHATCETTYAGAVASAAFHTKAMLVGGRHRVEFDTNTAGSKITVFWSNSTGFSLAQEWAFHTDVAGGAQAIPRPTSALQVQVKEFWEAGEWFVTIDGAADNAPATFSAMRYNDAYPPTEARAIPIRPYWAGNHPDTSGPHRGHGIHGLVLRFHTSGCDPYLTPGTDSDHCSTPNPFRIGQRWVVNITTAGYAEVRQHPNRILLDSYHDDLISAAYHSTSSVLRVEYTGGSLAADATKQSRVPYFHRRFHVKIVSAGDYATLAPATFQVFLDDGSGGQSAAGPAVDIDAVNGNVVGGQSNIRLWFADTYMYAPGEHWQVDWELPRAEDGSTAGVTFAITKVTSTTEAQGDQPSFTVRTLGRSFTSTSFLVDTDKSPAPDFKLVSAVAGGTEQLALSGDGKLRVSRLQASELNADSARIGALGLAVVDGGMRVERGGMTVEDSGIFVHSRAGWSAAQLRSSVPDFASTLLKLETAQAAVDAGSTSNFNFLTATNWETTAVPDVLANEQRVLEVQGDGSVHLLGQSSGLEVHHGGATIHDGGAIVRGSTSHALQVLAASPFFSGNLLLVDAVHSTATIQAAHLLRVRDATGDVFTVHGSGSTAAWRGLQVQSGGIDVVG